MRWVVLFQSIGEIGEIGGQPNFRFSFHRQDDIRGSEAEVIRHCNRLDGVSPHQPGLKLETEILELPDPDCPLTGRGFFVGMGSESWPVALGDDREVGQRLISV